MVASTTNARKRNARDLRRNFAVLIQNATAKNPLAQKYTVIVATRKKY